MQRLIVLAVVIIPLLVGCSRYGDQSAAAHLSKLEYVVKDHDPQLKTLYDYTVFHIGIYITLTTGILAALNYKSKTAYDGAFIIPLVCFAGAGVCGGIVGSNTPNYVTYSATKVVFETDDAKKHTQTVTSFVDGEYSLPLVKMKYSDWIKWEHRLFWWGALALIIVVVLHVPLVLAGKVKEPKKVSIDTVNITINQR